MVATFAAENNTYVPSHEGTQGMIVDFSRNVNDFPLNKYVQIVPVTKSNGLYLRMTVEEAGRIVNANLADYVWPDGADAPEHTDGTESFEYEPYWTKRTAYGFRLGQKASTQASWDIIAQHTRIHGQKAMTARTLQVATALTDSNNYDATHTSAVTSIDGVTTTWAASDVSSQSIQKSLYHAAQVILQDTLSVVRQDDLHLVISPEAAAQIRTSAEVVAYIKESPVALAQIRGELPGRNVMYGLPDHLYGFPVVVEDTARVTTRKEITTSRSFVWPDNYAVLCSRPGALEAPEGGPNFSTCCLFMYEEMTTELKNDADNRVVKGRVVEDYDVVMTAPVSGFLFTDILTSE